MIDHKSQPSMGQLRKLLQVVEGTPPWRMQQILASGILTDVFEPNASLKFRDRVRAALELEGIAFGDLTITIDYSKPFRERLKEADLARSPFANDETPAPFSINGQGRHEVWVRAFQFGTPNSSEGARNLIGWGKSGWSPGKLEDLLELASEENARNLEPGHYVALGSIGLIQDREYVPVLHVGSHGTAWMEVESFFRGRDGWMPDTNFIGVQIGPALD